MRWRKRKRSTLGLPAWTKGVPPSNYVQMGGGYVAVGHDGRGS